MVGLVLRKKHHHLWVYLWSKEIERVRHGRMLKQCCRTMWLDVRWCDPFYSLLLVSNFHSLSSKKSNVFKSMVGMFLKSLCGMLAAYIILCMDLDRAQESRVANDKAWLM